MPITVGGTTITFNDSTTQNTAFTGVPTTFGAVGTYFVGYTETNNQKYTAGTTTVAGSALRYKPVDTSGIFVQSLSGNVVNTDNAVVYAAYTASHTNPSLSGTWSVMRSGGNPINAPNIYALKLFVRFS